MPKKRCLSGRDAGDADAGDTIAISRSWELMGGPIGFTHEVTALVRGRGPEQQDAPGEGTPGDGAGG